MNDKAKRAQVGTMKTEAIEHILNTLSGPEAMEEPTAEFPLGGLVFLTGIGQVPVKMLREELASRDSLKDELHYTRGIGSGATHTRVIE